MSNALGPAGNTVGAKDPTQMVPSLIGGIPYIHGSQSSPIDILGRCARVASAGSADFPVRFGEDLLQREMSTVTVNMESQDCVDVQSHSAGAVIAAKGASVVGDLEGIPPGSESPETLISIGKDVVHGYFAVESAEMTSAGTAGALPACGTTDSHSNVRVESQQSEWPIRHGVHPISTIGSQLTVENTVYMSNHRRGEVLP